MDSLNSQAVFKVIKWQFWDVKLKLNCKKVPLFQKNQVALTNVKKQMQLTVYLFLSVRTETKFAGTIECTVHFLKRIQLQKNYFKDQKRIMVKSLIPDEPTEFAQNY